MTYARLPALASKANMRFTERRTELDQQIEKDVAARTREERR